MYIRSYRGVRATTIDVYRRKKETINPLSPLSSLLNYFKRLGGVVSLFRLRSICTKPRYK